MFGRVDVKMKAAPGTGIVSSIVLESDDLDEIDLEFLGGDTTQVETNVSLKAFSWHACADSVCQFFGKGNTTAYDRAVYYNVQTPQSTFHTYSVDWNSDRIEFIIDGTTVRTISSTDPLTLNGKNYPQTPMRVKLGNWAGGGPSEPQGTIEWAGGPTDFTKGPFVMYVESVSVQNNNPACSYSYGDESGTWQSIKMNKSGCAQGFSGAASSSSSGSASNSANQTSASGSASAAPMSSISVAPISVNSGAAVTSTVTGSSYSVNSASASAQNSNGVMATTEVPGSSPTSNSGSNTTGSSSGPAKSTSSSGSTVVKSCVAAGSLVGAAVAFFML